MLKKIYARGNPNKNKIIFKLKKLNNIYLWSKMKSEKNNVVEFIFCIIILK